MNDPKFQLAMAVSQVSSDQPTWETARRFKDAANRFEHGAVACRVMTGIVLLDLRETYGTTPGARTDLATSPHGAERLNWADRVQQELGISEDTAGRWMKLARAAIPRLQAGEAGEVFRQLLETPITQLSERQTKALNQAVEKLVDGRSQLDFMESLGLIAPKESKGGDREWQAFLEENHPELIVDGKVPKRGKVGAKSKEILAEFSEWINQRMKPRTPEAKRETARALLREVEDLLTAAVRNSYLGMLEPAEFVGVKSATTLWAKRLENLGNRK